MSLAFDAEALKRRESENDSEREEKVRMTEKEK
jgi:hypothetical protein